MEFTTAIFALGAISIVMLLIEVNFTYATQGFVYGWAANRDPSVEFSPLARRIKQAYQNQVDSISYTVPLLAAAAFIGLEHSGAQTAALLIVCGRALYGALYYTGIPYARLVGFGMATLSSLYLLIVIASSGLI